MHEHPTQGLLDLLTIRQVKGRIDGLRVAIIGDILHSRVARSASWGLIRLGADVVLTGPATLLPTAPPVSGVVMTHRVGEALEDADVIMVLRMQTERQAAGFVPSLAEYTRTYGITEHTLRSIRPDAILMHPGPANLGVEISAAAAYGPRSVISRQVTNGTFIRMAVLAWTLGAAPTHRTTTSDARAHTTARRPRRTDEIAPVVS